MDHTSREIRGDDRGIFDIAQAGDRSHQGHRGNALTRPFALPLKPQLACSIEAAARLLERLPEQRSVVDHIAKPCIRQQTLDPWRENFRALARFPHVHCKVSGMITEADHAGWVPEDLRPYLDTVFEAFGSERLKYGSDWPVCLLAGSYQQTVELVEEYPRQFSSTARDAIFGGNAARFHRIKDEAAAPRSRRPSPER